MLVLRMGLKSCAQVVQGGQRVQCAQHRSSSVRDSWIGQVNDSTGDIVGKVVE